MQIEMTEKRATANEDGEFEIVGLAQGAKIRAIYKQRGYGSTSATYILNGRKTVVSVHMFNDVSRESDYWSTAAKTIQKQAQGSEPAAKAYNNVWGQVNNSTISPEAKADAAHEFRKLYGKAPIPDSLIEYYELDPNTIANARENFTEILAGKLAFIQNPKLKPAVAADIPAKQAYQAGKLPDGFVTAFQNIDGSLAATDLKNKYEIEGIK